MLTSTISYRTTKVVKQPVTKGEVALVTNAGTDVGYQIAQALLQAGYRVASLFIASSYVAADMPLSTSACPATGW
jgi:16S rRNA C1402 (ribose-2'-O) methylase RsmI